MATKILLSMGQPTREHERKTAVTIDLNKLANEKAGLLNRATELKLKEQELVTKQMQTELSKLLAVNENNQRFQQLVDLAAKLQIQQALIDAKLGILGSTMQQPTSPSAMGGNMMSPSMSPQSAPTGMAMPPTPGAEMNQMPPEMGSSGGSQLPSTPMQSGMSGFSPSSGTNGGNSGGGMPPPM
jgi:hypothetical protein